LLDPSFDPAKYLDVSAHDPTLDLVRLAAAFRTSFKFFAPVE